MEKWADYCISRVRYNDKGMEIVRVHVHEDMGDTIGASRAWRRGEFLSALENGTSCVTIFRDTDGTWQKGHKVNLVTVDDMGYIRTDQAQQAFDFLKDVPEIRLHTSAVEFLDSVFDEELRDESKYDPKVVALVKKHLGQKSLHSRAGARLAEALIKLAQARAMEDDK